MILHWPQLVLIALLACGLGIDIAKHGEPKKGSYSVAIGLLSVAIWGTLLYYGGFWTGGVAP